MGFPRSSGVLLHPTSLAGRFGIGDLGKEATRFADFLIQSDQSLWQVLPLGPTGFGDSPYQCFSSFASNPLLISPELLIEDGLLVEDDIKRPPRLIGRNTVGSMQSGLYYGYVGLVDGILARLAGELPGLATVVATGGLAELIAAESTRITRVEPLLTLVGLKLVHERNR